MSQQDNDSGLARVGPGPSDWVDQVEARRILGVTVGMFEYWLRHKKITTGRWAPKPGGGKYRLYARAEVEGLAEAVRERRDRAARRELPAGMLSPNEAAALFGVNVGT